MPDSERRRKQPLFRSGPTLGNKNVSVPISFGLPLLVVGLFLLLGASRTDRIGFWIAGGITISVGAMLFASGKTL